MSLTYSRDFSPKLQNIFSNCRLDAIGISCRNFKMYMSQTRLTFSFYLTPFSKEKENLFICVGHPPPPWRKGSIYYLIALPCPLPIRYWKNNNIINLRIIMSPQTSCWVFFFLRTDQSLDCIT